MRGRGGSAGLALTLWLALIVCLPEMGGAADWGWWRTPEGGLPILTVAASSMEAQMLGEKTQAAPPSRLKILNTVPGLEANPEGGATLILPKNLELKISFLYNRDPASLEPKRQESQALLNYSLDYRLAPNLQVGLSSYLYYPRADQGFLLGRAAGNRVMGLGPGIKYDLGRWSFVLKMQLEPGTRERGENMQNWLRVWYVF